MPIYEYRCNHCEHRLEILQKISDEPEKTCPECGTDNLRKLVSAAAFKLKGTGWYETDFKDKKSQKDTKPSKNNKSESKKANSEKKTSTNKTATGTSSSSASPD